MLTEQCVATIDYGPSRTRVVSWPRRRHTGDVCIQLKNHNFSLGHRTLEVQNSTWTTT